MSAHLRGMRLLLGKIYMFQFVNYLIWFLVLIVGVTFSSLNSYPVQVNYYFGSTQLMLPILILIAMAIGALLGIFAFFKSWWGRVQENRRLQARIQRLERKIREINPDLLVGI